MIYSVCAVLFAALIVFLTVIGEKKQALKRHLAVINAIMAIVGAAVIPIVHFIVRNLILNGDYNQTWTDWAWDMFTIFYSISLPVVCILLGILILSCVLSFFTERRKGDNAPRIRRLTSCAASVIMLIIAPAYAFMTENELLPIDTYILVIGFAESMLFRIVFSLEYLSETRNNVKKK